MRPKTTYLLGLFLPFGTKSQGKQFSYLISPYSLLFFFFKKSPHGLQGRPSGAEPSQPVPRHHRRASADTNLAPWPRGPRCSERHGHGAHTLLPAMALAPVLACAFPPPSPVSSSSLFLTSCLLPSARPGVGFTETAAHLRPPFPSGRKQWPHLLPKGPDLTRRSQKRF